MRGKSAILTVNHIPSFLSSSTKLWMNKSDIYTHKKVEQVQTAEGRVDIAHIVGRVNVQCKDIITEWSLKARTPIHMATHTPEQIILQKQLSRRVKDHKIIAIKSTHWMKIPTDEMHENSLTVNKCEQIWKCAFKNRLKTTWIWRLLNENLFSVYKKKIKLKIR